MRWFLILLVIFTTIDLIASQTDILSITSFQTCVRTDSRYANPGTADNATTYINCSTNTATLPKITVVDLSLAPGIGSGDTLEFDISIVPSNVNNNNPSSPTPTNCVLRDPTTQLCTITTPATVKIVSTKIVYKYQLTPTNFEFPFCYASVTLFENFQYPQQQCVQTCDSNVEDCDTFGLSCIPVQLSQNSMNSMIQKEINSLNFNTFTDTFKLSSFNRVQQPYNYQQLPCSGFDTTKVLYLNEASLAGQCGNFFDVTNRYAIAYQGNLRNITVPDSVTTCGDGFPASSTYCRTPVIPNSTVLYDNPNVDVRVPTFMPMPSLFGVTPSPVYRNLITDPVTSADDLVEPENVTVNSLIGGSVTFSCVGYECNNNRDSRRSYSPNPPVVLQPSGFEIQFPSPFLTTVNSIVALNPMCTLYYITPVPQTFAEITVNVTTNPGGVNEHTETLVINNFEPTGSATSSPYRFVFGRIETIQTSDFVQGPTVSGAIMMCGGTSQSQFINMQCLINGVQCNDDQQVDFTQSSSFSEATNPWTSIMENSKKDIPSRTQFYPHVYDYMKPGGKSGKNTDKFIPQDAGQTFWYYINPQRLINDFGSECNKIGLGEGSNGNQQNANLFCNLDPHSCLPGLGENANGGLKQSLPCKVAQYMNLASGIYSETDFPYPYGYTSPQEDPSDDINADFKSWMAQNATSFMPTNPFIAQDSTGPPVSLYDPTNPQFWLGSQGGVGGSFLYYSPTTSDGKEYYTNVNVELVLDIVGGTFLEYTDSVAQGKINVEQSTCNLLQGGAGQVGVSITNQVSASTFPDPTGYALSLDCNVLNPDSGVLFIPNPTSFGNIILNPGETAIYNFTVTEQSGLEIVSVNEIVCLATLRYSVLLAANSDQQEIDCALTKFFVNTSTYNPGGPTPNIPDPIPKAECTGFCNLSCYINEGKPYNSGCFWIIMIVTALVGTLFLAAVITGLVTICKTRTDSRVIIANSQQYIDQEEESSRKILTATDNNK